MKRIHSQLIPENAILAARVWDALYSAISNQGRGISTRSTIPKALLLAPPMGYLLQHRNVFPQPKSSL